MNWCDPLITSRAAKKASVHKNMQQQQKQQQQQQQQQKQQQQQQQQKSGNFKQVIPAASRLHNHPE